MKIVSIEYPVIGWASTDVEIDLVDGDEYPSHNEILAMVADGTIEVDFSPSSARSLTPYLTMDEAIEDIKGGVSEVPWEAQVFDND